MMSRRISAAINNSRTKPDSDEEVVQGITAARLVRQVGVIRRRLQLRRQPLIFSLMECDLWRCKGSLFSATNLAFHQLGDIGQMKHLVQRDEVGFHFSRSHQVDSC